MKLTGKNKKQFEDWFSENNYEPLFYEYPLSMQFGVVVEYADSIGYDIVIQPWNHKICKSFEGDKTYSYSIHREYKWLVDGCDYSTRDDARKAAIKAFDKIVNGE